MSNAPLVILEDLIAIPPQPEKVVALVAAAGQDRCRLGLLLGRLPACDVDAGVDFRLVPEHLRGLRGGESET